MLELDIILNDPILREVYRRGIKEGIRWCATWKNGKQLIGILEKDLDEVLKEVDEGKYD